MSSGAHRGAPAEGVPLSLERINDQAEMGAYARYGMAKLANMAFSYELARREPKILSNAVHPGVVASTMLRRSNFHGMLGRLATPGERSGTPLPESDIRLLLSATFSVSEVAAV